MDKYIKAKTIIDFINDCLEHEDKITDIEKATLCAIKKLIERTPAADVEPVVQCRECIHRPSVTGVTHYVHFPDDVCPYQCDDTWYSRMPPNDWYCADGKRKDGGQDEQIDEP